MAHALRYLIRTMVARDGTQPQRPVGGTRFHFRTISALALMVCSVVLHPALAAELPGRFTVFSSRPVSDLVFVPHPAAPKQKLTFYPTARSPRYEYRTAMPLHFADATTGAVVAEAVIPAGMKDALLLFSAIDPVPQSGLRYQVSILDDGALRHGPGGLSILNLSGLALSGAVMGENLTLKAGLHPTLTVGSSTKVVLRTSDKGRDYQSYAEAINLKKTERALLILFPPFYKGSHEVQSRLLIDSPTSGAASVSKKK